METLRLKNLRCLKDTGVVELRPITILLGQNSSGKSTFLRSLPLLRQTVEARTRSPLLWFGRLVDFGGFHDAVFSAAQPKEISISLSIGIPRGNLASFRGAFEDEYFLYHHLFGDEKEPPVRTDVEVTIAYDSVRDIAFARKVVLQAEGHSASIIFSDSARVESVLVNGRELRELFAPEVYHSLSALAPLIRHKPPEQGETSSSLRQRVPSALLSITNLVKARMHGNTSFRTALGLARRLSLGQAQQLLEQAKSVFGSSVYGVANWTQTSSPFDELLDLVVALFLPQLLDSVNDAIASICRCIRYIEPLRATADRFYRFQDLAVDEIDSQGDNLPMFIHALSQQQLNEFQEWTKAHFGFFAKPDRHAGHLSLLVSESKEGFHNLADSGFGYSQVLPIATQLWWQSQERPEVSPRKRRDESDGGILAMEQPELHLHPRLQAHIADAFVAAIRNARAHNSSFRIVAETHSESIVNRLGELIASDQLKPNEVNIVLFERESAESPSKVSFAEYDAKGYLKNWPFGFFNASAVK